MGKILNKKYYSERTEYKVHAVYRIRGAIQIKYKQQRISTDINVHEFIKKIVYEELRLDM